MYFLSYLSFSVTEGRGTLWQYFNKDIYKIEDVHMMRGTGSKITLESYQSFVEQVDNCMEGYLYILDIERDLYYISERTLDRFNLDCNLFSDTANVFRSLVHKDDIDWLLEDLGKMFSGEKDFHDLDYRWMDRDGNPIWINCKGRSIRDETGRPIYMVGCVDEIGKKQKADNVSGLRGSASIENRVDALFMHEDGSGYCLHVGIDNFRTVNERYGMDYGDFVLRAVANCINDALLPGQEVYRVVADEYIVIAAEGCAKSEGEKLYRRIYRNIERFVKENNYETVFTVSGGIVPAGNLKNLSYTQGLKLTQFALGRAKELGKNQLYLFEQKDYAAFIRKREILSSIKESVSDHFAGFEVYYQPIMARDDRTPYAAEALLRYRMKSGENLSPYEFIPILEESGMIIPIGKWVMNEAMEFCRFMRQTHPNFKVNINVSYVQIQKSAFVEDFLTLLETHELPSSGMTVELTESGAVEGSILVENLWELLKDHGVNIALDDFGTGYSNLLYISKMTPDVVKLDRSFTVKAMQHDFERTLMTSTIQMVHSLGLTVCVEGVETEEELRRVHEWGADYIQGYYYSKPCPREEFSARYR